jgi:hypothetical protein
MQFLEQEDDESSENREKSMVLTWATTEELKEVVQTRPATFVATLGRHKRELCLLHVEVVRQ